MSDRNLGFPGGKHKLKGSWDLLHVLPPSQQKTVCYFFLGVDSAESDALQTTMQTGNGESSV